MAKTTITFELDDHDTPQDYADPIRTLCIVSDISQLLRDLDKYGSEYKTVEAAISGIRESVHKRCSELSEEWR